MERSNQYFDGTNFIVQEGKTELSYILKELFLPILKSRKEISSSN